MRLPLKIEQDVLSKHGIIWDKKNNLYIKKGNHQSGVEGIYIIVSDHELASIYLEWLLQKGSCHLHWQNKTHKLYFKGHNFFNVLIRNEDYCQCIFKAVKEVCRKEKMEIVKEIIKDAWRP